MKRFLALLLVGAFVFVMVASACADAISDGNFNATGLPILNEVKTYRIAITKNANSQNGFGDKFCSQEAERQTNVHIEWIDIPTMSWNEQVNIMIASENLPDAFSGGTVDTMTNKELFVPLTELIDKYAPHIKEMLEAEPAVRAAITADDGEIYSLPTAKNNPSKLIDPSLWINKEWLDKLGLEIPTTTDEFVAVLRAFKEQDPNGNGIADEIPFTAGTFQSDCLIDPMLGSFGAIDTSNYVYSVDKENVIFGGIQPGYYEGLKWLHELYAEGLLDNEMFTMDAGQLTAKAQNADVILGALLFWSPDSMDPRFADYVTVPPLKGPNGDRMWIINPEPLGNMQGFSITKACEDPAVLVRYYDNNIASLDNVMMWMWGPEGKGAWKRVNDTQWTQTKEYIPEGSNLNYLKFTVAGSDSSPMYQWSKYSDLEIPDARNAKKRAAIADCLPYCVSVMPNGVENPERANARNILFVDIDNYMKKFKATAIVDGIDDAAWQEHLKTCERLRVDEYTALWQEYYDSKK